MYVLRNWNPNITEKTLIIYFLKKIWIYVNPTSTTVDDSCVHVYNLYLHNVYNKHRTSTCSNSLSFLIFFRPWLKFLIFWSVSFWLFTPQLQLKNLTRSTQQSCETHVSWSREVVVCSWWPSSFAYLVFGCYSFRSAEYSTTLLTYTLYVFIISRFLSARRSRLLRYMYTIWIYISYLLLQQST